MAWREWPPSWDLDRLDDVRRALAVVLFLWLLPGVDICWPLFTSLFLLLIGVLAYVEETLWDGWV
jgi:hypothetical protein